VLGKAKRESAKLAIDSVLSFWQKARVPTRQPVKCWSKLEKLYEKYITLKKNKGRAGGAQRRNEEDFKSSLEDLFDIAHQNALTDPKVLEEDKDFLRGQREKGRKGYMAGVDTDFARYEERMFFRRLSARARREREERRLEVSSEECGLSTGSDSDMTETENSEDDAFNPPPQKKVSQEKQSVLTPELAALMDRMKLSARQAGALATGFAAVLGFNVSTLSTSPSTIYRQRDQSPENNGRKK